MGAVLAIVSSVMWGTADFIGGFSSRRLPPMAVYGWSQLAGCIALVVIATVTGSWSAELGYLPWAVTGALVGIVGMLAFYRALAIGPMGIISPLVALSVVIPVAAGLIAGESPAPLQVLGIIAAIVGVLLASGPELGGAESAKALLLALVALVSFGVLFLAIARGSEVSALMTMTGMRLTTMVICVLVLLVVRSSGGVRASDAPSLIALGVMDAVANVLFGIATTMGLLTITAVLGSLYPVVTALLAAFVLRERLRPVQYAGVASALIGVVLLSAAG